MDTTHIDAIFSDINEDDFKEYKKNGIISVLPHDEHTRANAIDTIKSRYAINGTVITKSLFTDIIKRHIEFSNESFKGWKIKLYDDKLVDARFPEEYNFGLIGADERILFTIERKLYDNIYETITCYATMDSNQQSAILFNEYKRANFFPSFSTESDVKKAPKISLAIQVASIPKNVLNLLKPYMPGFKHIKNSSSNSPSKTNSITRKNGVNFKNALILVGTIGFFAMLFAYLNENFGKTCLDTYVSSNGVSTCRKWIGGKRTRKNRLK